MDQVPEPFNTILLRLSERQPAVAGDAADSWAAVALILAPHRCGPEVLFIRRAERPSDPWSGHIALPGGRREPTDASLRETAERETREEVGLDLRSADLLGQLDDVAPRAPRLPALVIRPFVYAIRSPRPITVPSPEVASTFWVPLAALRRREDKQTVEIEVDGSRRQVRAFVIGEEILWGLTERILETFLALVPEAG